MKKYLSIVAILVLIVLTINVEVANATVGGATGAIIGIGENIVTLNTLADNNSSEKLIDYGYYVLLKANEQTYYRILVHNKDDLSLLYMGDSYYDFGINNGVWQSINLYSNYSLYSIDNSYSTSVAFSDVEILESNFDIEYGGQIIIEKFKSYNIKSFDVSIDYEDKEVDFSAQVDGPNNYEMEFALVPYNSSLMEFEATGQVDRKNLPSNTWWSVPIDKDKYYGAFLTIYDDNGDILESIQYDSGGYKGLIKYDETFDNDGGIDTINSLPLPNNLIYYMESYDLNVGNEGSVIIGVFNYSEYDYITEVEMYKDGVWYTYGSKIDNTVLVGDTVTYNIAFTLDDIGATAIRIRGYDSENELYSKWKTFELDGLTVYDFGGNEEIEWNKRLEDIDVTNIGVLEDMFETVKEIYELFVGTIKDFFEELYGTLVFLADMMSIFPKPIPEMVMLVMSGYVIKWLMALVKFLINTFRG